MPDRKQRFTSLILTLALAAANLVALNYLVAGWSTARVDLTDEGLYSISPATRRILTGLDEELTVYGYFSRRTHPKLAPLVPQIVDLLDEYAAVSRGKVRLELIDPGEDEAAEEEAADRFGVRSTPFRLASKYEAAIVNAYFALVVRYGDQYVRYGFPDLIQVDPTPDGDIDVRLRNLEYDLTRAIKKVVYGFRTTNELFERVETPVTLTAIWTPSNLPEIFAEVPETVRKAAEELEQAGGDKFAFDEIDPAGQSELADRLYQQFGVQPLSLGLFGGENFYLYALLEVDGRFEQIPLTQDDLSAASVREAVENALRRNTPGFLKTVGIVVPDQPELPPQLRMQFQMPPTPPPEFEEVKQFLGQDYQTREVDLEAGDGVPSEVDVLLVLKPRNLSEQAVYHLDQYLMRGGRVIIGAGQYDTNFSPDGLRLAPAATGLDDWLAHFGLTVSQTLVLDDQNQALPIPVTRQTPFGMLRTWELAPYPYLVQVSGPGLMNPDITAALDAVGIYWGSPLVVDPEASKGFQVLPILQSSPRSWTSDDLSAVARVDYEVPAEGTEPQLLAVALSGKFKSYFAGKPAPGQAGDDEARPAVTLEESPETRLVLLGNEQFVSDFVARALARVDGSFFVENLRFTQNLIDWVGLDNEMLGIRSRGLVSRRLAPIDDARRATVEVLNYVAPVAILLALGLFLRWRRGQVERPAGASGKA